MDRLADTLDRRVLLLVIDVQERINSVMADQRHLPRIGLLVEAFRALGLDVVFTEQYPKGLGPTVAELRDLAGDGVMVKETFSCVGDEAISAALSQATPDQVLVTGIECHVCVAQTALDLVRAGYKVHVPHDAVNSRRPADRNWALDRMARAGVVVTSTESALFEVLGRCGTDEFRTISRMIRELPVDEEVEG